VAAPPVRPSTTARPPWSAGRITAIVVGVLLVLVSLASLGGGIYGLWADRTQRDGGYVTSSEQQFSTAGSALVTKPTDLGSAGTGWLYAPSVLDKVRIRVTPQGPASVFLGIGPTDAVDRYLAGVAQTTITDFWSGKVEVVSGGASRTAPSAQHFWVASATGAGRQTLFWKPTAGSWSVVVMNANGRPGVNVGADLGATLPALPWIALGLVIAGAVFLTGGALLIRGALPRDTTPTIAM
jgi:hypothetical protein